MARGLLIVGGHDPIYCDGDGPVNAPHRRAVAPAGPPRATFLPVPEVRRFPPRRRLVALGALAVAGALALGLVQEGVRWVVARYTVPTGEAEWIWAAEGTRYVGPRGLYAVRDFSLPEAPAVAEARILADQEYLLWINGQRIGSNIYAAEAPIDRYPVGPLLEAGTNRVVVELRSSGGAGGLLFQLVDGERETLLVSDRRWRTFDYDHPGILEGWLPVADGNEVLSWGRPPLGRWGWLTLGTERPGFLEVVGRPWERKVLPARRLASGGPFRVSFREPPAGPGAQPALGPEVTFDWGREVTGYLVLERERWHGQPVGLLYTGASMPEPRLGGAEAAVILVPGSTRWRDPVPRRFRYVTLLGLASVVDAWVEPVPVDQVDRLPVPGGRERGVFGLSRPLLRTPIEDEVRRKLKRVTDRAGGEDL